jgi:hypothetical protein
METEGGIETIDEQKMRTPIADGSAAVLLDTHITEDAEMSIYTIVYESTATPPVADNMAVEIASMLATARRRNPQVNVSGALLVADGRFVQALEGDKKDVQSTFDRISLDPRHTGIDVLCAQTTPKRRFKEWSMAYVGDTEALRQHYAGEPLASLVKKRSGDALIDFMREVAMSDEDD